MNETLTPLRIELANLSPNKILHKIFQKSTTFSGCHQNFGLLAVVSVKFIVVIVKLPIKIAKNIMINPENVRFSFIAATKNKMAVVNENMMLKIFINVINAGFIFELIVLQLANLHK